MRRMAPPLAVVPLVVLALLASGLAGCISRVQPVAQKKAVSLGQMPVPSRKDPARMTFDPGRPCFTRGEMTRARAVLFRERARPNPQRWLRALNRAFFELGANCADGNLLVAVLTVIQQESGVAVDPPLQNRNLNKLLGFKLERLRKRNPLAAKLLNASGIEDALKAKLRRDNGRKRLRTEGDLVRYVEQDLKVWFKGYLNEQFSVPGPVARLAAEIGISMPVTTIGPMQVNVSKAYRNARARGDEIKSSRHMRSLLLGKKTALERGLKEGVYLVRRSYRFYRARLSARAAVRFTAADYNSGEFSSRNAAFQARVAKLSGKALSLDGDLLVYRDGRAQELISNTEHAVKLILPRVSRARIRKDLLLEKAPGFSDTRTVRQVCTAYKRRLEDSCRTARMPTGAGNETARLKTGRSYTPENYARAFMRRFDVNSGIYWKK
jgi:hypothetical protein